MKRTKYLEPLSHDHHLGLVAVAHLKRELSRNAKPDVLASYVHKLWNHRLVRHFRDEEAYLMPLVEGTALAPLGERMLREHDTIKSLVQRTTERSGNLAKDLAEFSEALREHIRFEERELFPAIEATVPKEVLLDILGLLQADSSGE